MRPEIKRPLFVFGLVLVYVIGAAAVIAVLLIVTKPPPLLPPAATRPAMTLEQGEVETFDPGPPAFFPPDDWAPDAKFHLLLERLRDGGCETIEVDAETMEWVQCIHQENSQLHQENNDLREENGMLRERNRSLHQQLEKLKNKKSK